MTGHVRLVVPSDGDGIYSTDSFISTSPSGGCGGGREALRIHTHAWRPKGRPQALGFWVHGLNAHASRAADHAFARKMVDGGIAFFAHDQPSFGRSDGEKGRRAFVSQFSVWTTAAMDFLELVCARPENEGIPFVLLGESQGGMVVFDMSVNHLQTLPTSSPLRCRWRGVAMIAPGIILCEPPPPVLVKVLKVLARTAPCMGNRGVVPVGDATFQAKVWHPTKIADGTVAAQEAADATLVEVVRANGRLRPASSLGYSGMMKLSTAYAMKMREEAMVHHELAAFDAPNLLLLHGTADGNVHIHGSELLRDRSRTLPTRKALVRIEGGYHDLLNDPATEQVVETIRTFVLRVCAEAPPPAPLD